MRPDEAQGVWSWAWLDTRPPHRDEFVRRPFEAPLRVEVDRRSRRGMIRAGTGETDMTGTQRPMEEMFRALGSGAKELQCLYRWTSCCAERAVHPDLAGVVRVLPPRGSTRDLPGADRRRWYDTQATASSRPHRHALTRPHPGESGGLVEVVYVERPASRTGPFLEGAGCSTRSPSGSGASSSTPSCGRRSMRTRPPSASAPAAPSRGA